ncbi:MAG: hypothetical protein MI757_09355, partial [Pirellulales bacterium]|nr:hypothetical protein [Pirellulales bacterium]
LVSVRVDAQRRIYSLEPDGLREVERLGLHERHNAICVAPSFSQLPWYADHPTDDKVRQESHFIRAVLPEVDKILDLQVDSADRYLLGFSKSGWGAWSLLLRNPTLFKRAAAWDAPMNMERYGKFGSAPIFGTQENFLNYHVPTLLEQKAAELRKTNRLVLTGYDGFRKHHEAVHAIITKQRIQCDYRDGPRRKHRWDSDWLPEAFELLLRGSAK